MRDEKAEPPSSSSFTWTNFFSPFTKWDVLLGMVSAFHLFMAPYTKVEESFNIQAMHDILYHHHNIEKYDHREFPGVVPRTFLGAFFVSLLSSPFVVIMHLLNLPKLYTLLAVRLVMGIIMLWTLRFLCIQVKRKFGHQVEKFFVLLTALQFHLLFYSTRPLPNIFALCLVNLAYAFWLKGSHIATLRCLIFATLIFRCDILLLLGPIGLLLLLTKAISVTQALRCGISTGLLCIGCTILVDSFMWRRILWPEMEVFWFNSVLNRSSEWGTHPFHWYFTSALPRSLLAAYPLCFLGFLVDKRMLQYTLPVASFVLIYSKLPHKELRFIMGAIPMLNLSAAVAINRIWASPMWNFSGPYRYWNSSGRCPGTPGSCPLGPACSDYNNRRKGSWKWVYLITILLLLVSLGCTTITSMASYENYPSAYALKLLHQRGLDPNQTLDQWVHIDTFAAINGISRFCENNFPWSRYSKEEGITIQEFRSRNFTYLLSEHRNIPGYACLFSVSGFSRVQIQLTFPPFQLVKEPKVFVHGNMRSQNWQHKDWPGCE
ncbi:dol-P-Man:Man(7)GlcNAc(2)-PP-Dol alpha-1,6-mannosyltransferase isoform X3 [Amborella trichopoda]|uniref:dol-P-Man:Man(7)GlcNAc(2)-PP-Dol alpha-1,6-mannosyltransferase isoform X3 n=1 Tax=Amborella trichopoda TaxID=13333 RepID=UPI0009BD5A8C|nr:dol-P-Man:Man(7)GlcNAc(2)-PP-Dol alpha-1,6-mannosyltransferase isoform X3 [Amborella trichopoda]|eukprot:XP_020519898.1 dol-P-Man:Man(7)GlcNAc(2)-PP-Dol alpha-1,6-mannosyltransferase isoform X3 [Amborella trichopoda]